ncbi:transcriptional regulator, AraC family [Streptosporangium subroseum]|uniref:Transcriptional regulator, AraC family n=1 Tax=Streptosporangium subroseum TaxID=106412 RepID=A0A239A8Z2_9ACTN|nr:helix-turn-helix domain-containing protein [Streptosporangium subroseum]SNR91979.1 transcriptional regulator, AraC family [Streptosporangium subroseum]
MAPITHLREQRVGTEVTRVLPDNQSDIIVSSHGQAWIIGPATGADLPMPEAGTTLKGLRIDTAWLSTIVGVHAAELTDRRIPLDDLFPAPTAHRLVDALWAEQFDREPAELLWPEATADNRVTYTVAALTSRLAPTVGELSDIMGLSPRHPRRLVEQHTGLTPKTIQQVARLHHAIRGATTDDRAGIAQIAASTGYSDQAHLGRDVRRFSGLTPAALFEHASPLVMAEKF